MWPSTLELQALQPAHAHALQLLMLSLPGRDRRMRFGHALDDAALCGWTQRLPWNEQRAWGLWAGDDLGLVAALHLFDTAQAHVCELAVVVHPRLRRRGLGSLLLHTAIAQAPDVHTLLCAHGHPFIRALSVRHRWPVTPWGLQAGWRVVVRRPVACALPGVCQAPVKSEV
jgi:GNAT superfamily N-acetyltransferase